MDTTEQMELSDNGKVKLSPDEAIEVQREIIRPSLNAIAHDIGMLMRDSGLNFPVYLCLPNSGDAVVTVATPLDPSDEDWLHATAIVSQVVATRLGGIKLSHRPLTCAIANANMSAADLTADVKIES